MPDQKAAGHALPGTKAPDPNSAEVSSYVVRDKTCWSWVIGLGMVLTDNAFLPHIAMLLWAVGYPSSMYHVLLNCWCVVHRDTAVLDQGTLKVLDACKYALKLILVLHLTLT